MFGFFTKLPISDDERQWVDQGFERLEKLLGRSRMLGSQVVTPTAEDFPDVYDETHAAADLMFRRVCSYMQVDRRRIDLEIFPDETEELRAILPYWPAILEDAPDFTVTVVKMFTMAVMNDECWSRCGARN